MGRCIQDCTVTRSWKEEAQLCCMMFKEAKQWCLMIATIVQQGTCIKETGVSHNTNALPTSWTLHQSKEKWITLLNENGCDLIKTTSWKMVCPSVLTSVLLHVEARSSMNQWTEMSGVNYASSFTCPHHHHHRQVSIFHACNWAANYK